MRDVNAEWLEYLQNNLGKTMTKCLRVITKNNQQFGTTTHTRNIFFNNLLYHTSMGLLDTAIARTEGFSVDNVELTMAIDATMQRAIEAGLFDDAKCYLFFLDYTDLSKGEFPLMTGRIGEITRDQITLKAEVLGLMSLLKRKTGRMYLTTCDVVLGSDRCRVILQDSDVTTEITLVSSVRTITRDHGSFATDGFGVGDTIRITDSIEGNNGLYTVESIPSGDTLVTVESIPADEVGILTVTKIRNLTYSKTVDSVNAASPRRIFEMNDNLDSLGNTMSSQWLFGGLVTFLTGDNAGISRDISYHSGSTVECYLDFPYNIQPGDELEAVTGCDYLFSTCKTKFDNAINFQGFPHSPSDEEIYYIPAAVG